MCLDKVLRKPKRLPRRGYKFFASWAGRLYSPYHHQGRKSYPIGKWIVDKENKELVGFSGIKHDPGFHIFLEDEAWSAIYLGLVQRRVAFRNVVAYGEDYNRKTVVAREMMILPEEKREGL